MNNEIIISFRQWSESERDREREGYNRKSQRINGKLNKTDELGVVVYGWWICDCVNWEYHWGGKLVMPHAVCIGTSSIVLYVLAEALRMAFFHNWQLIICRSFHIAMVSLLAWGIDSHRRLQRGCALCLRHCSKVSRCRRKILWIIN